MRSLMRRISLAWMAMSEACPWAPPQGWWMRMRELGSAKRLPVRARGQEHRAHGGGLAHADRLHVGPHQLHGVVDGHARGGGAARAVDVDVDVLLGVLGLQEQELGDDQVRHHVVDGGADEDDVVLEEARVDVVGALAAGRLLHDHGDERARVRRGSRSFAKSSLALALSKSRVFSSRIRARSAARSPSFSMRARIASFDLLQCAPRARDLGVHLGVQRPRRPRGARSRRAGCPPWPPSPSPRAARSRYSLQFTPTLVGSMPWKARPRAAFSVRADHVALHEGVGHLEARPLHERLHERALHLAVGLALLRGEQPLADVRRAARRGCRSRQVLGELVVRGGDDLLLDRLQRDRVVDRLAGQRFGGESSG